MTRPSEPVLRLRARGPSDSAFLRHLFGSTRQADATAFNERGIDPAALLDLQFRAQDAAYQQQFPGASFDIIEADDRAIGRLYVNHSDTETRIVEVSLLPEWRNRGIGQQLLAGVVRKSLATGRPVTLHVATGNPARRLYERLGFTAISDDGVNVFMRRSCNGSGS